MKALILALALLTPPAIANDAYEADLPQIENDIGEAQRVVDEEKGLISEIARARLETLKLSKAIIENRQLAESGDQVEFVQVPLTPVNTATTDSVLADINSTLQEIRDAEDEVATGGGGLVGVLAVTRLETLRLTLAQLKLAYYQAAYGIALPAINTSHDDATALTLRELDDREPIDQIPEWADPEFPSIDYTAPAFQAAHDSGASISGWWTITETKAAIDDSPRVNAINHSLYSEGSYSDYEFLLMSCREGESAVVYLPNKFVMGDFDSNYFNVTVRQDENQAQASRWSKLTNNRGAGLFGLKAEQFMRELYTGSKLFVRLKARSDRYDSLFDLSGIKQAIDAVAGACGWTTLALSTEDYKAIQSILNAAGYKAGTADGVWGRGSRSAMKAFQKSVGLQETGAPTRESLTQLGYDIE